MGKTASLNIDATVVFSQIDGAFVRSLDKLEPYGQANPEPLFCAVGVDILPKSIRVLKDQHLKFTARQGDVHKDVIAFRMAERFCKESLPEKADMVFTPQINTITMAQRYSWFLRFMSCRKPESMRAQNLLGGRHKPLPY